MLNRWRQSHVTPTATPLLPRPAEPDSPTTVALDTMARLLAERGPTVWRIIRDVRREHPDLAPEQVLPLVEARLA